MAGRFNACPDIRAILATQMDPPLFPVPMRTMRADLTFEDFRPADTLTLDGGLTVRTAVLNHPDGACGYRIDHEGGSLAYVTDTGTCRGVPDRNILELIDGADLVIYDATYTEREFACKAGWGHSTWVEGIKLCQTAGARRLALFHHEPDHDDADMEAIEAERGRSGHPSSRPARGNRHAGVRHHPRVIDLTVSGQIGSARCCAGRS